MREELGEDFAASTLGHGFLDIISWSLGVEAIPPEELHVGGLSGEVRLVGDHDAEAPVAVFEGCQSAGAGGVAGEFCEVREEEAGGGVQRRGEGEPGGFWDAGVEVGRVAEFGGVEGELVPEGPGGVGEGVCGGLGWG